MPNTLTDVKDIKVAQTALQPWMAGLLPLRAFSTNFSPESADKLNTVRVPVVGAPSQSSDFAGIANDQPDDDKVTFELDTSMAEDPIQTHPNFDALKTKYGWDGVKEQFAKMMPETSAGQPNALSGGGNKSKKNPLFGVEHWLVVGAVFRKTYSARTIPANLLKGIGTIVERPPGIEQFHIPAAAKKCNWLKLAPKIRRRGNAVEITEEYMLSGPSG